MTHILHIDASARTSRSITRDLSGAFVSAWRDREPAVSVTHRDVGRAPPPIVDEAWIAAAFAGDARTPAQQATLAMSETLIDEIEAADVIVLGTPMYNYGMPAALKAWFDQVVRIGRTFTFDLARGDRPLEPILSGRRLAILASWGEFGFGPDGVNARHGHLVPHIRSCARYLGADVIEEIAVEYQEFGDDRHSASYAAAFDAIPEAVERLRATTRAEVA